MTTMHRTTASAGEGMDFVISDGSLDRHGTRINPKGWDFSNFLRNPIALFGHSGRFPIGRWENVRVEKDKVVGRLVLAAEGTSARIDELRKLVEQGILRAVSVGFSVLEWGQPGKSTFDIEKQSLHEVSLVSVGSNTNALAAARSLNISESTIRLAFGEHAEEGRAGVSTPGKNAVLSNVDAKRTRAGLPSQQKANPMEKSLSKRIEETEAELVTERDALAAAVEADDSAEMETRSGQIEVLEERLSGLLRAEKAMGQRAGGSGGERQPAKPAVRKPLGIKARQPKPGDIVLRAGVVQMLSYVGQKDPIKVLEERYGDHEETNIFVRAAVDPAKTSVSGWASELIETETVAFLETLREISFYPRLAALGANLQFGPGRGQIKVPARASTPSISGSFVAEGSPIPVRRIGLTSATLSPHKMGVISYFTREVAKYSTPQIAAAADVERRLTERLASLKDGESGCDGKDGADGRDGTDGADGISITADDCAPLISAEVERALSTWERPRDGASVTIDEVAPVIDEAVRIAVSMLPRPKDGADGKDGRDGLDGTSVSSDELTPVIVEMVQRAIAELPVPKDGRDGVDGNDGRDGLDGASVTAEDLSPVVAEVVERAISAIPAPKDGRDGIDGKDGRDGLDGKDGERGEDGSPGRLPAVRDWSDTIHYEGAVVCHGGSTFQAQRDTAKEPPHEDWVCIARGGSDGRDGRSFSIRGTWSENAAYQALDVVALGGASFAARRDDPGSCPGGGWQLIAAQGKRGNPGERSMVKGDPGKPAPTIERMTIDDDGLLTITNSDGTTVDCDLYPLLSKLTRPESP